LREGADSERFCVGKTFAFNGFEIRCTLHGCVYPPMSAYE